MLKKIRNILWSIRNKLHPRNPNPEAEWICDIGSKKWAYISYVTDQFFDEKKLALHQNRQEAIVINKIFNELGYNTFWHSYENHFFFNVKRFKFDVIFGLEPNFETLIEWNPLAKSIYYGTTAYYEFHNKQIVARTDQFNKSLFADIPYKRIINPHKSYYFANNIIQIGTSSTKSTYPGELQEKVKLIRQSTINIRENVIAPPDCRSNFLCFGGTTLLKGIYPLLNFFIHHTNCQLYIVGELEEGVIENFELTKNIHLCGWLQPDSIELETIVYKCSSQIFLSSSEGGIPGSVLLCMKYGLIPILYKNLKFDDFNDVYYINDLSDESIDKAIDWVNSFSNSEYASMQKRCKNYADNNYNLNVFSSDFKQALEQCLHD